MVTSHPVRETREAALVRLASKAREDGIKLFRDPKDGRFYASSRSQPGRLHYVTGISCTCAGFIAHQRCAHLAALHSALGWLDGAPEPEPGGASAPPDEPTPPAPGFLAESAKISPTCPTCNGTGSECGTVSTGRSWTYASVTCATCHGTGQRTAAAA